MKTAKKGDNKVDTSEIHSPLKNKKIEVWPVKKPRGLVKDPDHEASFLFGTATNKLTVPMDRNGKLVDPLDPEEREWFEYVDTSLSLEPGDTSIYKDKDGHNMWTRYKIDLSKQINILDLNDPQDYLDYKVLLANKDKVAPSWEERHDKATYLYALVDQENKAKNEASLADKRKRAYMHYGKVEEDPDEMKKFLRIYGNKPPKNAKVNFLKSELDRIISEDLDGYLAVAEDPDYDMKDFINSALTIGALIKDHNKYKLPGGDVIGQSLKDTIDYLNSPENQDIYLDIQAKLEASQ